MVRLLFFACLCVPALGAGDPPLETLRGLLVAMRGSDIKAGPRGATPQMTVVKHQLRDWVELRLRTLAERGDATELERALNADLRKEKLIFNDDDPPGAVVDLWNLLEYAEALRLQREGVFLVLVEDSAILPSKGRILVSLNLKNPKAYELASELSKITGESLTTAVINALEQRLERERQKAGGKTKAARMLAFAQRFAAGLDPALKSEDHAWLYDENGLPK